MSTAVYEPIRRVIAAAFTTGWAAFTPIKYDNIVFNRAAASKWVALNILMGGAAQMSMDTPGRRLERQTGVVIVQTFNAKNVGSKATMEMADKVGTIFRHNQVVDGDITVNFGVPELGSISEEVDFFQVNVQVPFQADAFF